MPDMLVKLYELPDTTELYKKLKENGIELNRVKFDFAPNGTSTLLESTRYEYETLLHRFDKNNVEIEKIGTLAKAGNYGETGRIKFEYIPGTEKVKSVSMLNGLGGVEEVIHNPSESMLTNIYLKHKVR